jgi:hypothetical protein
MPKSSPNQTQLRIKSDLKTTSVSMPVCMPQHLSMNTCLKYLESFSWPHVGTPRGGTLRNANCATTMKRRSILEYTTHNSTFCMLCMHRTLISIRIYIYICIHGIMRFTHNYPQISIRYQISTAAWTRASGMLWLMVSTKKLSRSMGDEASPERWLEVPKALRLFRYTLRIG